MRIVPLGRLFVLSTVVAVLLPALPAYAAMDPYMTIKGSKQGQIKGAAMSGQIRLVSVARDTATGMSTGRRTHATITIVREIDRASPKLFQALSTNEVLSEVVINFNGATRSAKTAQRIVGQHAFILYSCYTYPRLFCISNNYHLNPFRISFNPAFEKWSVALVSLTAHSLEHT